MLRKYLPIILLLASSNALAQDLIGNIITGLAVDTLHLFRFDESPEPCDAVESRVIKKYGVTRFEKATVADRKVAVWYLNRTMPFRAENISPSMLFSSFKSVERMAMPYYGKTVYLKPFIAWQTNPYAYRTYTTNQFPDTLFAIGIIPVKALGQLNANSAKFCVVVIDRPDN